MSLRLVCAIGSCTGSLLSALLLPVFALILPHTVHSVIGGFVGFDDVWAGFAAPSDDSSTSVLLPPLRFKIVMGR